MPKLDKSLFYDYGPVLSHNAVFNFIVGGRGIGKSYGAKVKAVKKFLDKGEQFILLRRYKEELSLARKTFFSDIAQEFPGIEFRANGNTAEICRNPSAPKKERVWEVCGHFVALSQAQQAKSVSYHLVTLIIFDEFIIEKGAVQYLNNEFRVMMDFFSTVDRWQDKTRVVFLANAVSIANPYFLELDIHPNGDEFMRRNNGFVVCHFPMDSEFGDAVKKTKFGQFIAGTEYEQYSIHNQFKDNTGSMIQPKSSRHKYMFTLETDGGIFSCWRMWTMETGVLWHVQSKLPREQVILTTVPGTMTDEKRLVSYSDSVLSELRTAFRQGRTTFDRPQTRNSFIHIFNRK